MTNVKSRYVRPNSAIRVESGDSIVIGTLTNIERVDETHCVFFVYNKLINESTVVLIHDDAIVHVALAQPNWL